MSYPPHTGPYSSAPYDESHTFAPFFTGAADPSLYSGMDHDFESGDLEPLEGQRDLVSRYDHHQDPMMMPPYSTEAPRLSVPSGQTVLPDSSGRGPHGMSPMLQHGVDEGNAVWHPPGYHGSFVPVSSEPNLGMEHHQAQAGAGDQHTRPGPRNSFPSSSVAPLREWFAHNQHYPYPPKQTKLDLSRRSGLSLKQVNSWFINARKRRLPRSSERNEPSQRSLTESPELLQTPAIDSRGHLLPVSPEMGASSGLAWEGLSGGGLGHLSIGQGDRSLRTAGGDLSSLTSSSLVPASLASSDVTLRVDGGELSMASSRTESEYSHSNTGFSSNYAAISQGAHRGGFSGPSRAPSSASIRSASSMSEVSSIGYPTHWIQPRANLHDLGHNTRGGDQAMRTVEHEASDALMRSGSDKGEEDSDDGQNRRSGEIFQCTFPHCGKSFGSKTWKRHEETKHLPRVQWTCMSTGFIVPAPPTPGFHNQPQTALGHHQQTMCAFCHQRNPDRNLHPQECAHRLMDCLSRPHAERTFHRKDHLFQHLRNFHRMSPADTGFGADWKQKVERAGRTWGCGFCGERLGSWERRARHLRAHFREGWRVETHWDERKARTQPETPSS